MWTLKIRTGPVRWVSRLTSGLCVFPDAQVQSQGGSCRDGTRDIGFTKCSSSTKSFIQVLVHIASNIRYVRREDFGRCYDDDDDDDDDGSVLRPKKHGRCRIKM